MVWMSKERVLLRISYLVPVRVILIVIFLVNTIHDGIYGVQGPPQE